MHMYMHMQIQHHKCDNTNVQPQSLQMVNLETAENVKTEGRVPMMPLLN